MSPVLLTHWLRMPANDCLTISLVVFQATLWGVFSQAAGLGYFILEPFRLE